MKKGYYFVYSVGVIKESGELVVYSMILDHEEVYDIINRTMNSWGESVESVNVSMFDENGNCIKERDITDIMATYIN